MTHSSSTESWPPLPLDEWADTYATLHLMTQVVGKVRLACAPMLNHWWQVPLYVTSRGLSTSAMPHGTQNFEMEFDFIDHSLNVTVCDGGRRPIALRSRPIAEFHEEVMGTLHALGVPVRIWPQPVEIEGATPLDQDFGHGVYVPEHAHRFWRVLRQADRALAEFRSAFLGKSSPVHFFWGSFDLATTRFSGRRAPEHPGGAPNLGDWVMREAYSHECSSCGFWPGGGAVTEPAFYAYSYPEPTGYRERTVRPDGAYYSDAMHEYILPYDSVRRSADPDRMLADFFRSTYEAGADLAQWNRSELERDPAAAIHAVAEPAPTVLQHPQVS